jgi:hypothetical protein
VDVARRAAVRARIAWTAELALSLVIGRALVAELALSLIRWRPALIVSWALTLIGWRSLIDRRGLSLIGGRVSPLEQSLTSPLQPAAQDASDVIERRRAA